jgi:plastocyanin
MNTHVGRRWLWGLAAAVLAAAPLFFAAPPAARAANTTVFERGVQYVPAQIEVAVGATVTWVYTSSPPGSPGHTVTFSDRDLNPACPPTLLLDDCQRSPGDRVSRTFSAPGTYPYYCKIHRSQGMTGVVIVTAASSSTTAASASSSSTTATTVKPTTTTATTAKPTTSSTTSTTRQLATSSTVVKSTTTTSDTSTVLLPGAPPPLSGDDANSAAGPTGGSSSGSDTRTVGVIVGLLLAVSVGGGYLLWRLRPGRS